AFFVLAFVFAAIFAHHMRRSTKGRLVRVQVVNLVTIAALAIAVKVVMLTTSVSILVVPVALLALVPTMVLDRVVGLATGILGALTQGKLIELEDLSHPLLKQIAEKSPGTWQHSLMMANMAEIAANAIGASGRHVRVGAYFHDLGKSLQPKYFIENLEPGETSP